MSDDDELYEEDFDPVAQLSGPAMRVALADVARQRRADDDREGYFRDYADGTAGRCTNGPTRSRDVQAVEEAKRRAREAGSRLTWRHFVEWDAARVCREHDEAELRKRLVELAALAVAWVEAIDRRKDEKRIERKMRGGWWLRMKAWFRRRRR